MSPILVIPIAITTYITILPFVSLSLSLVPFHLPAPVISLLSVHPRITLLFLPLRVCFRFFFITLKAECMLLRGRGTGNAMGE